jgi:NAD(P)-dependent dehydrogenase (short-subunit alcohol dehydrogenase family)
MQSVNPDGLYATVQLALPHLRRSSSKGRIVVVSPPIYSRFFRGKTAYAMGKIGMSVLTKGLAMDFDREREAQATAAAAADDDDDTSGKMKKDGGGMAITSIWPAVAIESAATAQFTKKNPDEARDLRKATIFSHAVLAILRSPPSLVNGELLLDEDFLRERTGKTDFSEYSVVPGSSPRRIMPLHLPDLTVAEQADEGKRYDSSKSKL